MTKQNAYGVSAEVAYDFGDWTWEDRSPGLVARISSEAGETILKEMAKDASIWIIDDDNDVPAVECSFLDHRVVFTCPLTELIDKWLRTDGEAPEDRSQMLALLEGAIATIRAHD